jgi:uncharacterized BrkB/YihY/UPF0761 family membrane protein
MTGKEQARLLGLLFWLLTAFQLFLILIVGIIYAVFVGAILGTQPHRPNDPPPEIFIPIIIAVVAILFVMTFLFAIPKIVAGYGLRKEKPWARTWAIVASVMAAMHFPFGTAVGVYGLIFLFGDAGKAYFDGPKYGSLSPGFDTGIPFDAQSSVHAPEPAGWRQ